ncbi:hypothetical protein ACFX2A_013587 [Malus domestica]
MTQGSLKDSRTQRCSDKHTLEVSTASLGKNHMFLIKPSYFQEEMEIYERKLQWYMTPLRTLLSYGSLRKPGPLTRRILDTPL